MKKGKNIIIIALIVLVIASLTYTFIISRNYEKIKQDYKAITEEKIILEDKLKENEKQLSLLLKNQPPKIKEITFTDENNNDIIESGWVVVPPNGKVIITFELEGNCTDLDLFITPTGTETYLLQQIIDRIYVEPNQKEVTYVWQVPNGTMGHFWVNAYNNNLARVSSTFNIYSEYNVSPTQ